MGANQALAMKHFNGPVSSSRTAHECIFNNSNFGGVIHFGVNSGQDGHFRNSDHHRSKTFDSTISFEERCGLRQPLESREC